VLLPRLVPLCSNIRRQLPKTPRKPTLSQVWRPRGFFSICHGSLLLPNRNLDGVYQRLELSANYRINAHSNTYANLQNLSYRLK